MSDDRLDFFISYTQADAAWAQWVAWELEDDGHSTVIQAWDFTAGRNFADLMDQASRKAEHTLAILSPAYLQSPFGQAELWAAFTQDPMSRDRRLLPVRVRPCEVDGLQGPIIFADLVGLAEDEARERLLKAASGERLKPESKPSFPGDAETITKPTTRPHRFPGKPPPTRNSLPHRNPHFAGREKELAQLHEALQGGTAAVTQAIHGLGGVGKTHLAVEYVYRHMHDYDVVWWLASEEPASLRADYLDLGRELGVPEAQGQEPSLAIEAIRRHLENESRWLLVFDNAEKPDELEPYLPRTGRGACLVTSRTKDWRGLAREIPLHEFRREESLEFLLQTRQESPEAAEGGEDGTVERQAQAERLADELGDLPLALEQAMAYLEATGMSVEDYLEAFSTRWQDLMSRGGPRERADQTVAATWEISVERLEQESKAGLQLLEILAWLAPDDVPLKIFHDAEEILPLPLAEASRDRIALHDAVAAASRLSLLEAQDGKLSVHRLVQLFTRERLGGETAKERLGCALQLVNRAFPYQKDDPATWELSGDLLQHAVRVLDCAIEAEMELEAAAILSNNVGLYLKNCLADLDQALFHLKRSLEIGETVYGPEHPTVAIYANNVGQILKDQGDLAGALEYAKRSLEIDESVYGPAHPTVAIRANNIATILQDQGDLAGALEYAKRSLEIDESVYGPEHPTVARDVNNIGQILQDQGDLSDALEYAKRALEIDESVYGPAHPTVAIYANNVGLILRAQGDLSGALEYAERSLEIDETVYGPEHPQVATDANNVGQILLAQGDLSGALESTQRALEIDEMVYGPQHPTVARDANNIAAILRDQGDLSGALESTKRALEIDETVYGPAHPAVAIRANNIATILQDQGDLEAAEPWLERAVGILERTYGAENPTTQTAAGNLELLRKELEKG